MRAAAKKEGKSVRKPRSGGTTAAESARALKAAPNRDNFLPVFWEVDRSLPLDQRPLTGADITWFATRHGLKLTDVIYALCIQNSAKYNEILRLPALPFTLELIIRLYDRFPGNAPWTRITPSEAFEMLYAENMKDFAGKPNAEDVKRALYWRFTAALGRSIYTALRWIEDEGEAKPQILKIFSKLSEIDKPREVLEEIAGLMFRVRNESLDEKFPLPTLLNPPAPRRRGPPLKSEREAAAALRAKQAAAKSRVAARAAKAALPAPSAAPVVARAAKTTPSKAGAAHKNKPHAMAEGE